ncbi:sensor histidine kinase [Anaerocolumna sp. MB42-C2]|uniref:sensor histidine kinase n=1 Tax=Anaerocolumna sp. MB42-C2 TaxID=3070997 RepID=UPI0027E192F1|nr:HAMP domain-containing sensor histidine kinase [Anaerocolumna sp. MB42-C2]WMJ87950.1 HAMP domain-containing sensor histidine kinase [Anaerocolumna sp. MB42-C2]
MLYIIIGLSVLCIYFAVRFIILSRSIQNTAEQMEEIQAIKDSNRILKAISTDKPMEKLLQRINILYDSGQRERIQYQRRETQIRKEIENISHDLRTPLTSIMGYVDLIQDPLSTEVEKEEYLNIIYKRAKVLQGFIEDFYELSRMEGEEYPVHYEIISAGTILKEVVVSYYQQFEKKGIQVDIQIEEKPCYIIADKIQLNRIFNNLIQNALKYTKSFFRLKLYSAEEECIILFQNDHNLLKDDEIEHIFDRFYTGDETRNGQSTGLGLTIAKLLTENMKGKISAKIKDNLFTIEINWKIK